MLAYIVKKTGERKKTGKRSYKKIGEFEMSKPFPVKLSDEDRRALNRIIAYANKESNQRLTNADVIRTLIRDADKKVKCRMKFLGIEFVSCDEESSQAEQPGEAGSIAEDSDMISVMRA